MGVGSTGHRLSFDTWWIVKYKPMVDKKPPETKRRFKIIDRAALLRLAVLAVVLFVLGIWSYLTMIKMPGESYRGDLDLSGKSELTLAQQLERDVTVLATEIGERNVFTYAQLEKAAAWIETSFREVGYEVRRQEYEVSGRRCANLEAELKGTGQAEEIIVIGGHYDSVSGCPGANDNATGVAVVLALARAFAGKQPARTIRFVAFVNEEPPFFQTEDMGSLVYAKACKARGDNIVAMLSMETMGYYSDEKKSQKYPWPFGLFYPSRGNFITFVGNVSSRKLVREVVGRFRRLCEFPSEAAALPSGITGVGWSDHWSFWQAGYPALMVTDTAPFRYAHYHTEQDTPDTLDFERMAQVVLGLEKVIEEMIQIGDKVIK